MENAHPCPVVGIGASAGGLETLKKLFAAMPADSGLAFIVVPHLDPGHASLMVPLLAACTAIPVSETTVEALIEPNHVYVIPPNRYLSLANGRFLLEGPVERSQVVLDLFLRTLAEDQKDNAICIILSGTGAHGSQGVRAIKAQGGLTIAQEPTEAQFAEMPKNAIATGLVDVVCPVEEMPEKLLNYTRHVAADESAQAVPTDCLEEILALLRAQGRLDFRGYRKRMLLRRIRRRMGLVQVGEMKGYLEILRRDAQELNRLERDLTISVTHFFRDPGLFEELEKSVIPKLVAGKGDDEPIRIWVPGCATGEEAYSLGILLLEALSAVGKRCALKIFATDIDESGLEVARAGLYPHTIEADVSAARLARFFTQTGTRTWRVGPQLREAMTFARHNLLGDMSFSRMDLVSCRNVLIYLESAVQQRMLQVLHFALSSEGYLILGPSETVGLDSALFEPVTKKWRVFRKVGRGPADTSALPGAPLPFSGLHPLAGHLHPSRSEAEQIARRAEQALLAHFAPAAVVVKPNGQIVYFHGSTGLFLDQPTGSPTQDLFQMTPMGLRAKLRAALGRLSSTQARIVHTQARLVTEAGLQRVVSVRAFRLPGSAESEPLILLAFGEEAPGRQAVAKARAMATGALDEELGLLREELQTKVGELQDANEDLKSSAEELMSMNEEMQSANEELETSKEELQSLNEELTTVNGQLQEKVEALEQFNADMDNLLRSSDIAVLFLDRELRIRWFSPAVQPLINLIAGDVGRPLVDIALRVTDPDLLADAQSVLETLVSAPREIRDDRGQWWLRRIVPYRAADQRIDGVVITFTDVDAIKRAAAQSRRLDTVLLDSNDAVVVRDLEGRITHWNRAAADTSGYSEAEVRGLDLAHFVPLALREQEQARYARIARGEDVPSWETQRIAKDGHLIDVWVTATPLFDEQGLPEAVLTTARDITEYKRKETQLLDLNRNLERLVTARTQALEETNRRLTQEIQAHQQAEVHIRHLNESLEERVTQRTGELTRTNQNLEKFSYSIAHDLRAPLRAIHGFASILDETLFDQGSGEQHQYLDRIKANSVRMGDLIDDILAFSRLSRAEMHVDVVDMEALARRSLAHVAGDCPQAQVHISALPPADADPSLMECVFDNLLSNALKFSGQREQPLVEVGAEENAEGETVFFVRDNGVGLDMACTSRLFDPFIRLHEPDAFPGTGVGLAIVKNAIERHNGRVWVQSAPDQGATFSFTLGKPQGEPKVQKTDSPPGTVARAIWIRAVNGNGQGGAEPT